MGNLLSCRSSSKKMEEEIFQYTLTPIEEALNPKLDFSQIAKIPTGRYSPSEKPKKNRIVVPDRLFVPAKIHGNKTLSIRFSEDWTQVGIKQRSISRIPPLILGWQTSNPRNTTRRFYFLDLFAGGQLVIEKKKEWMATFVMFGSGVPVTVCFRGPIKPDNNTRTPCPFAAASKRSIEENEAKSKALKKFILEFGLKKTDGFLET